MLFNAIKKWIYSTTPGDVNLLDTDFFAMQYHGSEGMKKSFLDFINEFDPNIQDLHVEQEMNKDGETIYRVFTIHNGKRYPLDIESQGTQKLFLLHSCI